MTNNESTSTSFKLNRTGQATTPARRMTGIQWTCLIFAIVSAIGLGITLTDILMHHLTMDANPNTCWASAGCAFLLIVNAVGAWPSRDN